MLSVAYTLNNSFTAMYIATRHLVVHWYNSHGYNYAFSNSILSAPILKLCACNKRSDYYNKGVICGLL